MFVTVPRIAERATSRSIGDEARLQPEDTIQRGSDCVRATCSSIARVCARIACSCPRAHACRQRWSTTSCRLANGQTSGWNGPTCVQCRSDATIVARRENRASRGDVGDTSSLAHEKIVERCASARTVRALTFQNAPTATSTVVGSVRLKVAGSQRSRLWCAYCGSIAPVWTGGKGRQGRYATVFCNSNCCEAYAKALRKRREREAGALRSDRDPRTR